MLIAQGVPCEPVFGDPALLIPRFIRARRSKRYILGVVPHFSHRNNPRIRDLTRHPRVKLISIFAGLRRFLHELAE
jgi:hypothetical protein